MKTALVLAVAGMLLVTATVVTALAASKPHQVSVSYVLPKNPKLLRVYELLKERRALEKLQEFLSPFRLPRALKVLVAGWAVRALRSPLLAARNCRKRRTDPSPALATIAGIRTAVA